MKFEGHKTALIALMISFGSFLLAWKCYTVYPHRYIVPKHELLISDFALKSRFDNITLSILLGFVVPIIILVSTKVYLIKKSNNKKQTKTNHELNE